MQNIFIVPAMQHGCRAKPLLRRNPPSAKSKDIRTLQEVDAVVTVWGIRLWQVIGLTFVVTILLSEKQTTAVWSN